MAVTPETIAVALGVAAPAADSTQYAQWQMWIDDALMLIGARLGDVTLLDQAALDYVVRKAVVAQTYRPTDGASQIDVSIDDGRISRRYDGAGVTILDEWWDLLTPDGSGAVGAFTISPYGAADSGWRDSPSASWA